MNLKNINILSAFFFQACTLSDGASDVGYPIRPLAQEHVVVGVSPDPGKVFIYNPTILALPNGRLVAGYDQDGMKIFTSDDRGKTWQYRTTFKDIIHGRLIIANNILYLLGSYAQLNISKSIDNGVTWSEPVVISRDRWHQSATNFICANGNIYLAKEKRIGNEINAWIVGELSPIVMRAKETADLTDPKSWTFSQDFAFKDIIPGYRENDLQMDYFGVPFYPQNFPANYDAAQGAGRRRNSGPFGWLEANIVQITDPNHYWYDPQGKTFHILMRAHTGGTGYAALVKAIENEDGTITTSLETVPSGKRILFIPMPGGQMRFHITYDEKTKIYWHLGSQAFDSMTRADLLTDDRFGLPNNERHRMVLHFSKNLVDWCFAGVVAISSSPREARHYAAMDIDGDDLVILSRSGDEKARNAHDGNMATFHRVKNFRKLVY